MEVSSYSDLLCIPLFFEKGFVDSVTVYGLKLSGSSVKRLTTGNANIIPQFCRLTLPKAGIHHFSVPLTVELSRR